MGILHSNREGGSDFIIRDLLDRLETESRIGRLNPKQEEWFRNFTDYYDKNGFLTVMQKKVAEDILSEVEL